MWQNKQHLLAPVKPFNCVTDSELTVKQAQVTCMMMKPKSLGCNNCVANVGGTKHSIAA
jgi:hypothetical protein